MTPRTELLSLVPLSPMLEEIWSEPLMESVTISLSVAMAPQPSCYCLTGLVVCLFSNVWLRCALSSVFLPFLAGSGRAHESELQ